MWVSLAAANSSEPLWSSIPRAIGPAVTATVAVAAAVAGYFKFIRGRTFQPRLTLILDAEVVRLDTKPALRINVTIKNDGLTAVVLDACYAQRVDVFVADQPVWDDAVGSDDGSVLWFDGVLPHRSVDVLSDPGLLTYQVNPFRGPIQRAADAIEAPAAEVGSFVASILEPGEQDRAAVLLAVDEAMAYLVQLSVHACGHAHRFSQRSHRRCVAGDKLPDLWQTRTIVKEEGVPNV